MYLHPSENFIKYTSMSCYLNKHSIVKVWLVRIKTTIVNFFDTY